MVWRKHCNSSHIVLLIAIMLPCYSVFFRVFCFFFIFYLFFHYFFLIMFIFLFFSHNIFLPIVLFYILFSLSTYIFFFVFFNRGVLSAPRLIPTFNFFFITKVFKPTYVYHENPQTHFFSKMFSHWYFFPYTFVLFIYIFFITGISRPA